MGELDVVLAGQALERSEGARGHLEGDQALRLGRMLGDAHVRDARLFREKTKNVAQRRAVEGEVLWRHAAQLRCAQVAAAAVVGLGHRAADHDERFVGRSAGRCGELDIGRAQRRDGIEGGTFREGGTRGCGIRGF